jgi:hypothetical protein
MLVSLRLVVVVGHVKWRGSLKLWVRRGVSKLMWSRLSVLIESGCILVLRVDVLCGLVMGGGELRMVERTERLCSGSECVSFGRGL